MFYQGLEQLIWSRYLSKVCIKSCFWIRYFIIIIQQKKLRDFLGIYFKICACSKLQLNSVGIKIKPVKIFF